MSSNSRDNPFNLALPEDARFLVEDAVARRRVGLFEQLSTSFSAGSSVAGVMAFLRDSGRDFAREEGFDPIRFLTGEELEQPDVARVLARARSRDELEYLRQRRAELVRLGQTISAGPLHPLVSMFLSGIVDPINLIPLGWAGRLGMAARGAALARGASEGAAIGFASAVIMQPFSYAIDPFRGMSDTLVDLAFGSALGTAFGAAGVGLGALMRRRTAVLMPDERTPDVDPAVRAMVREGIPPETASAASHEARAAMNRALNEIAPPNETPGRLDGEQAAAKEGESLSAARVVDNGRIIRDLLREALLKPELGPFGRAFSRLASRFGAFRYPGIELATSPFRTAREFVYSYGDPGLLTAALIRQLSDAELKKAYAEAQKKGLTLTEDEFIAAARDEMAAGLAVTERGNFEARRALLMSQFHGFVDVFRRLSAEAVKEGLVPDQASFDTLAATWARFRQEPHRFSGPPTQNPKLAQLLNRAFSEWQNRISKPFLERIRQSGLWDTYGKDAKSNPLRDLDAEYFPKQLDVYKIAERPVEFQDLLFSQIRDAADSAKSRVDAYDAAVKASKESRSFVRETLDVLSSLRGEEAENLHRSLKEYSSRIFLAQRKLNSVGREIEKHARLGSRWNIKQWLQEMEGRESGERPGTVTDVDRALIADYQKAQYDLVSAQTDYSLFVASNGERIKELTGKVLPETLTGRPVRPASYERDRLLAYGDGEEPGLAGRSDLIRERAREITAKLLAGTDPHLQMEYGLRASLKAREVDLNPQAFEPYFKQSFVQNVEAYVSIVSREVAAMEKFGSVKSEDIIARLTNDYINLLRRAKSPERQDELRRRFEAASALIQDLMAEARGVRNQARSNVERKAREAARALSTYNYTLYMGSGLLAQIGDTTRAVMAYGLMPFIKHSIKSFAAGVTDVFQKIPRENLNRLATAMEWSNLGRERALYEIAPPEHQGVVSRGVTAVGNLASRLTLMPLWNDWLRTAGVRITDDLLVRGLEDLRAGKQPSYEFRVIVSKSGIGAEMLERIGNQIEQYKNMIPSAKDYGSPIFDSNMEAWFSRDREAFEAYRLLLHTGAQQALVYPSTLDSPMWTQNAFSGLLLQFKRFVIASVPQMMIPFLQQPAGKQFVIGLTAVVAGAVSTVLRDLNSKGEVKNRNAAGWVLDSLDMSGLASGLTEVDAVFSALTGARGIKRLLTGEDYTRWQERQRLEGLIGPSARTLRMFGEAMWLPYDALSPNETVAERQVAAVRRLIPILSSNLFLRHPVDMVEASLGGRQNTTGAKILRATQE
jgi:hypothetical protein